MKPTATATAVANLDSDFDNASEYMENVSNNAETSQIISLAESACTVNRTTKLQAGLIESGVPGIQMCGNGLVITKEYISAEEFNTVFRTVLSINKSSNWLLGDILLLGDRRWGNQYTTGKYEEAMQATGLSRSTLRDFVQTCKKFPVDKRHAGLSFTHHQEVARTDADPDQREEVLKRAADEKLTCTALRKQLLKTKFKEEPEVDLSRPPVGEEPDRLALLDLPERVSPDAPPKWDAFNFGRWAEKQEPCEYTREQCEAALDLLKPLLEYHEEIMFRLKELDEATTTA